ncbi:hypothetical protein DFH08DRAFT_816310 [Mycena albidolilacea]|uniref:Uncharacterized protein n=1 Tax=Mycena albidolilacea TaxID=1033008 RepID=A0AAD6ZK65_9AGAR|nr:hypothetical protein DFH08DRAFT_816310 [Mycena albidolilacea]
MAKSGQGQYFKMKIGAVPADRTLRLHKAEEKKRQHGEGFLGSFQCGLSRQKQAGNGGGTSRNELMEDWLPLVIPMPNGIDGTPCTVTVEVIGDNNMESLSHSEIGQQQEDGLGNFEEWLTKSLESMK